MKTGRPAIHPQEPKLVSISIAELRELGLLDLSGAKLVRWTDGYSTVIQGRARGVLLGAQPVDFKYVPANLGGFLTLFLCPNCHYQRERMFLVEGKWACRKCRRVTGQAQLLAGPAKAQRELARYAARANLPAWRLKRSAHRIPKLIEKLKGMK